jgi:hypothetical protein
MTHALPIVAVFAWAGPAPAAPFSEPPRLEKPQAGFYRLKIGKVDVIAVNDGASSFGVLGVLAKDKRGRPSFYTTPLATAERDFSSDRPRKLSGVKRPSTAMVRHGRKWPASANLGDAASRQLSGYTGRAANAVGKAATDRCCRKKILEGSPSNIDSK